MRNILSVIVLVFVYSNILSQKSINEPIGGPLPDTFFTTTDENGNKIELRARGNSLLTWYETKDGDIVIRNGEDFEYAKVEHNSLKSTGVKVGSSLKNRPNTVKNIPEQIYSFTLKSSHLSQGNVPTTGNIHIPVILIDYSDIPFKRSKQDFDDMFNKENYQGKQSMKQYYQKASHGKLNITFDVYGWYNSGNSYKNYSDSKGMRLTGNLLKLALAKAEADGADFSKYDNDNDGDVDAVILVHSGEGADGVGDSKYIWAHRWSLSSSEHSSVNYDGVVIDDYVVGCETRAANGSNVDNRGYSGIGQYCHEFGHALGMPDFYASNWGGLGYWAIMSGGAWLGKEMYPSNFNPWCRVQFGWDTPVELETNSYGEYTLETAANSNQVIKLVTNRPDEYFLLENIQRDGVNVQQIGTGLAIFQINEKMLSKNRGVNDDKDNPGIRLVEADFNKNTGLYASKSNKGSASDLFPGTTQKTSFNNKSNPAANFLDGTFSGFNVEEITEQNESIKFKLNKVDAEISWSSLQFSESPSNDGSIVNEIKLVLVGDSFTGSTGVFDNSYYTVNNLPSGYTIEIEKVSNTTLLLKVTGTSANHTLSDNITNLEIEFKNSAFEKGSAASVSNSVKNDIKIVYKDKYSDNVVFYDKFEDYSVNEMPKIWELKSISEFDARAAGTVNIGAIELTSKPYKFSRQAFYIEENWKNNKAEEFTLISPVIDFSEDQSYYLSFAECRAWDADWPVKKDVHKLQLLFSTDKSNWQLIKEIEYNKSDFKNWVYHKEMDITSVCRGKKGYIAFKINSHVYYWRLDDFKIEKKLLSDVNVNITNQEISIYPNPVEDKLNIRIVGDLNEKTVYEIYNVDGKLIERDSLLEKDSSNLTIDVSKYKKGVYALILKTSNNVIKSKFVKR